MKKEYDLSTMKSRPNPYAKKLKKQVTMRLETDVIEYLKDCVISHRELSMKWQ